MMGIYIILDTGYRWFIPRLLVGASMIFAHSSQSLLGEDDGRMAGSQSNAG